MLIGMSALACSSCNSTTKISLRYPDFEVREAAVKA